MSKREQRQAFMTALSTYRETGTPDAEVMALKFVIVREIKAALRARGIVRQEDQAEAMGLARPDASKILRGRFSGYSVERLMKALMSVEPSARLFPSIGHERRLEVAPHARRHYVRVPASVLETVR